MDIDARLLQLINGPGPHSGDALGQALGISRVAVQKRLAAMRTQGLPLRAAAGSGYQLEPGVCLLDAERIREYLDAELQSRLRLEIHQQIESTNLWIQSQVLDENQILVCLAEAQRAGRGRRGAGWVATPYRNLLFSLGWRFGSWPSSLPGLSLVVGLVACQVLDLLGIEGLRIKWPNDIYRDGAKLAGILVQASGEASGYCDLAIGLGLNLHLDPQSRAAIDQPCTDLSDADSLLDRNQIAALLIEGLTEVLPLFAERGFAPFRECWEQRALYLGEAVRIKLDGREQRGKMLGVDEQGALIFKSEQGETLHLTEADISLRPA